MRVLTLTMLAMLSLAALAPASRAPQLGAGSGAGLATTAWADADNGDDSADPAREQPSGDSKNEAEKSTDEKPAGDADNQGDEDAKDKEQAAPAGEDDADGDTQPQDKAPEGVRRTRPRSAEDERAYKQRKTREDPFLNPPGGMGGAQPLYNVRDWLTQPPQPSVSSYMVQDDKGALQGYLTLSIELRDDPVLGRALTLTQQCDFGTPATTTLSLIADTYQPRSKEWLERPAPDSTGAVVDVGANRMLVDYLFDRVTVTNFRGGVIVSKELRQLPQSFDIDELPLLVRLLNYQRDDWPFEAALTDPAQMAKNAVAIQKPVFADVLSAEPQTVPCYQLELTLGDQKLTWWVQRRLPRRLIKFAWNGLTYTLFQYTAAQE